MCRHSKIVFSINLSVHINVKKLQEENIEIQDKYHLYFGHFIVIHPTPSIWGSNKPKLDFFFSLKPTHFGKYFWKQPILVKY